VKPVDVGAISENGWAKNGGGGKWDIGAECDQLTPILGTNKEKKKKCQAGKAGVTTDWPDVDLSNRPRVVSLNFFDLST
jgi:hypothetical protein